MTDEDGVVFLGVQLAERLIDDGERRNALAVEKLEAVFEIEPLGRRGDDAVSDERRHGGAEDSRGKGERRKEKAESRKQKAEGRRQKAERMKDER